MLICDWILLIRHVIQHYTIPRPYIHRKGMLLSRQQCSLRWYHLKTITFQCIHGFAMLRPRKMVFLINFDRKAKLHVRGGGAGTLNIFQVFFTLNSKWNIHISTSIKSRSVLYLRILNLHEQLVARWGCQSVQIDVISRLVPPQVNPRSWESCAAFPAIKKPPPQTTQPSWTVLETYNSVEQLIAKLNNQPKSETKTYCGKEDAAITDRGHNSRDKRVEHSAYLPGIS